jgi:enoyl-CoA hydratase/carnithine racemase
MENCLIVEHHEGIAVWKLNRPESRNPISEPEVVKRFLKVVEDAQNDQTIRVVILTGNGSAFSSGGNVKKIRKELTESDKTPNDLVDWYRTGIQRIPLSLNQLDVPLIAAVNGPAIGAGLDLACMCDIRIAAESATFAESFVKLGLVPGDGGAWFLPRVVGLSKACEMAFTGDPLSAREALACGLVSKVVPDGQLMDEAMILARRIVVNPPLSVRMAKQLIREGQRTDLETHLQMAAAMQAISHRTGDHREAMAAISEKRTALFKGK